MHLEVAQKTLGALLSTFKEQFVVPLYQRPYAWTAEQVDVLWDDVTSSLGEEHFLGSIVLNTEETTRPQVIDGQQRLATLQIVLAAIRDEYERQGSDLAGRPHQLLLADDFAKTPEDKFKLRLGEANWPVFRDFILRRTADSERMAWSELAHLGAPTLALNEYLIACAERARDLVGSFLSGTVGTERIARLELLEEKITVRLSFVEIRVGNVEDAFLLFETLNDRGLQLSAADLVKSHLLSRYEVENGKTQVSEGAQDWSDFLDLLRGGDIGRFLRYFLLMQYQKVQKDRIFKLFKEQLASMSAKQMLTRLKTSAKHFGEFMNPLLVDHVLTHDALEDLLDLRASTCYVALLPAREALKDDLNSFARFARLAEALAYRWTTIVGANAQELETIFQAAGSEFVVDGAGGLEKATKRLLEAMPTAKRFRDAFNYKTMGTQYVARYTLRRIEEVLSEPGEWMLKPAAKVHVEHIMPKHLSDPWIGALGPNAKELHGEYVSRWGNLTLLSAPLNSQARDAGFKEKVQIYKSSKGPASLIELTKLLSHEPDWTPARIEGRQRWMGIIAEQVWGADFAMGRTKTIEVPPYPFLDLTEAAESIRALINQHESANVELKSTARTNLVTKIKDAKIELSFGKTICGFANSKTGGTLLVGVADDEQILGCEIDYQAQPGGVDGYIRWVNDFIKIRVNPVLATEVSAYTVPLDGHDVLRVDVPPSSKPAHLKDQPNAERFFVRVNNATEELTGQQMLDYCKTRWPS